LHNKRNRIIFVLGLKTELNTLTQDFKAELSTPRLLENTALYFAKGWHLVLRILWFLRLLTPPTARVASWRAFWHKKRDSL